MKKTLSLLAALIIACSGISQTLFEVFSERSNEKTYKGFISRDVLEKDSSFTWLIENRKGYTPNNDALNGLKKNKDSINLLVIMGTWCEDSHFVIPKLFHLLDAAGFAQEKLTLIGVDRKKKTYGNLTGALHVDKVPTIMVMKNGTEIGRVVEFGKFGLYDLDLGSILKTLN